MKYKRNQGIGKNSACEHTKAVGEQKSHKYDMFHLYLQNHLVQVDKTITLIGKRKQLVLIG